MAASKPTAARNVVTRLRTISSEKALLRRARSLPMAAISRFPRMVMPIIENRMNQWTTLSTKLQMPILDTPSTLDTYG